MKVGMMVHMAIVLLAAIALMVASGGAAGAAASNVTADFHLTPPGTGDCQGNGVEGYPVSGFVNVHYNPTQGRYIFNIHIRGGQPNQEYGTSVRCVNMLEHLTTDDAGNADLTVSIPAAGIPRPFSFGVGTEPDPYEHEVFFTGPIYLP